MKLTIKIFIFTILSSSAAMVSMEKDGLKKLIRKTDTLYQSMLSYQHIQHNSQFVQDWVNSTVHSLVVIHNLARLGRTELLPDAINSLLCTLPKSESLAPELSDILLEVDTYKKSTPELLKDYNFYLYKKAETNAYVEHLRGELKNVGSAPLSDYL